MTRTSGPGPPAVAPGARTSPDPTAWAIAVAPGLFTAGWVWSGARSPGSSWVRGSVSSLSELGTPSPRPVLAGQATQGVAQLLNARLAARAGLRPLAGCLALSGLGTLVSTGLPLSDDPNRGWAHRAHTWGAGVGMATFHLAALSGVTEDRLPAWSRRGAAAALAVALPTTGYFVHRLARRQGVGRAYGLAERVFLSALLGWTSTLPWAYPAGDA